MGNPNPKLSPARPGNRTSADPLTRAIASFNYIPLQMTINGVQGEGGQQHRNMSGGGGGGGGGKIEA